MKSKQFLKLHRPNTSELYINSMMISAIYNGTRGTLIVTMSGEEYTVTESIEEVFKLIDKSNTITFKSYSG
jgi:uncharacterized protein YlzI (FlbEa/FlbD family)